MNEEIIAATVGAILGGCAIVAAGIAAGITAWQCNRDREQRIAQANQDRQDRMAQANQDRHDRMAHANQDRQDRMAHVEQEREMRLLQILLALNPAQLTDAQLTLFNHANQLVHASVRVENEPICVPENPNNI